MIGSCAQFARALLDWYDRCQRKLPWRATSPGRRVDPWAVLVSELMLQQTQVATVIPYFNRFMNRFPTPAELAVADEREVLRLWQGLGDYARARHLRAAACKIVADFGGGVPSSLAELGSLPGVGRYTAGAVASIAYGLRAPILDGNVARIVCRLERIRSASGPGRTARLWRIAEQILPHQAVGDFNSALMDLGATICTARSPRCEVCPVRRFCKAAAAGVQGSIPSPRRREPTPLLRRWTICLRRNGRWLLEQRPTSGRWAGMWQFTTVEADTDAAEPAMLGQRLGIHITDLRKIGQVRQALTHRRYVFDIFTAAAEGRGSPQAGPMRRWVKLPELDRYPLPRPHAKVAEMLSRLAFNGRQCPRE